MTRLEELPARVDDLTGQILQLRGEMGTAFSAMSDRIDGLTDRVDGLPAAIMSQVRILHEDVIDRLKIIQEGQAPRPRRAVRKKR